MDAALRALERCCICSAYFPPRQSAKKRRMHLDECARLRGLSADDTKDCLLRAAAHVLREERERQAAAAQERTLFARYVHHDTTPTRVARLEAVVGIRPDACSVGEARAMHVAARASCDDLLDRYCARPAAHECASSLEPVDAGARRMLAQLERHAARLAPPRRAHLSAPPIPAVAVPTSDDDEGLYPSCATRVDLVVTSDEEAS
ncbi:Hypothetical protein MSYG_4438 [Malassezia sympodialis ATCC 42132]|uniref:Uncharacterized protein n=1 Tax=Malassezia sympodialis (strain ATCC 42132) TaxID=1230383 RepID=A0A1M8ACH5_MALS4|nr:Hypothetical protein MSYG_4438 [Malassezia sympodialis ATCC 42132]